jgi:hypothetical protein
MAIRITCISKANGFHLDPHHAITDLGWVNVGTGEHGRSTRQQVYDWLKSQGGQAFVLDRLGNKAYVFPRENTHGTQYVQTVADRVWTDNLLALPECKV